jgi:hypothetical protein
MGEGTAARAQDTTSAPEAARQHHPRRRGEGAFREVRGSRHQAESWRWSKRNREREDQDGGLSPIPGFIVDICMEARHPKMQPKLVHGRDAIVRRFSAATSPSWCSSARPTCYAYMLLRFLFDFRIPSFGSQGFRHG